MTDVQIIIICTAIVAFCAWSIHNSTKTIAARLYCRIMGIPAEQPKEAPKSPYGIIRECGTSGKWGYCITKHGKIYRSSEYASSPVYPTLESALSDINVYEKLDGYKLTVLEDL